MKPKTLSASSLGNWEECQQKFVASNIHFTPETGDKSAAKVGTAVHYALEHFVRAVYMEGTHEWVDEKHLLELYEQGYKETFGNVRKSSAEWRDGRKLTKDWHARTDLSGWEIDNVEEKKRTPIGKTGILLTYIFDRVQKKVDADGKKILKVVDYKTIRRNMSHDQLRDNLQVRIYAMAAMIEYREWGPDEVWVELDLLRHQPVGVKISRDENVETWKYLNETANLILETEESAATYTLGSGCMYCPVKATCPELRKNIEHGGIMSLREIDDIVSLRVEMAAQRDGLDQTVSQLDEMIFEYAKREDVTKFESSGQKVSLVSRGRRTLSDTSIAAKIIGPEVMATVGKINISDVDKLLDGEMLTEDQREELEGLIVKNFSKPSVRVDPAPPLKKEKK